MHRLGLLLLIAAGLTACKDRDDGAPPEPVRAVDSILPMDVMLDRFRQDLPRPSRLASGATSRDSLVAQLVAALQARDTTAIERLTITRAEWAWLYFPTDLLARPPYELPPSLAWFRLVEDNRKGVLRALRELGGQTLVLDGYRCRPDPTIEDANRIWVGCLVALRRNGGAPESLRLFSAMLERDGRFTLLSLDNDF